MRKAAKGITGASRRRRIHSDIPVIDNPSLVAAAAETITHCLGGGCSYLLLLRLLLLLPLLLGLIMRPLLLGLNTDSSDQRPSATGSSGHQARKRRGTDEKAKGSS